MPLPVVLFLFVVIQLVPGWVMAALAPRIRERLSLTARVAVAVSLSILQLMLVGLVLISLGLATPTAIVATNLAITLALAFLARRQIRRDRDAARAAILAYKFDWVSVAVVAMIGLVAGSAVWRATNIMPAANSAWGYAADIAAILEAGGFPDTNLQYGEEVSFAVTKAGGFAWLGSVRAFTGLDYTRSVQLLPLATLFGALVGTWAIFRTFAGRLAAAFGVFFMFLEFPAYTVLVTKYSRFTVESAGITLGLLAVWATIAAGKERVPELRWLAAAMIVLAGLTHGVAATVTVILVACYQLALIILGKLRGRQILRNAFVLGAIPGLGVFVGLRLWSRAPGFALAGEGYELVGGVGDPTRALRMVLNGGSIFEAPAPGGGAGPGQLFDVYAWSMFNQRWPLEDFADRYPVVILLLVGALIAAAWIVGRRQVALTVTLFLLALFIVAVFFELRYDLHVFRTHPQRREFHYAGVALVGLAVATLSSWRWRALQARRTMAIALVGVLVVGSFSLDWALSAQRWRAAEMADHEKAALDWLREETPEGSRILTNVRSTASFVGYAQRNSLTEGDTPYIYPERLTSALTLLDTAQRWFSDPNLAFLDEHEIDYVVITGRPFNALGGDVYARQPSRALLTSQPFLKRLATFENVVMYSVRR